MYILGMAEFMAKKLYDITICNNFFPKSYFGTPLLFIKTFATLKKNCVLVLNFYIKCIGKRSKIESHM